MATNFIQNGDYLEFTAGADVTSGELVELGSLYGIAQGAVANGAVGILSLRGVYTVPKTTGAGTALTVGAPAYFDASAAGSVNGDDETGANTLCGHAVQASADGAATAKIRLLG